MPIPALCKENLENLSGIWALTIGTLGENLIVVEKSQTDDEIYIYCHLIKVENNPTEVGVMTAARYGIKIEENNFLRKHSVVYTPTMKAVSINGNALVIDKNQLILPGSSDTLRSMEKRGADLIERIATGTYKWSKSLQNAVSDKNSFAAGFSQNNCNLTPPLLGKCGFFRVNDKFCIFSWADSQTSKTWFIDTRNIKQRVITEATRKSGESPRVLVYFTQYEPSGKVKCKNDDYYGETTLEYNFSDPKEYLFKSENNKPIIFRHQ